MVTENKNLSSGLEDYLETIYIAHVNNKPLKGAELARQLNVSRASVSEALAKLVAKKLINYNSYENISITNDGLNEAKKVYQKHHILETFFHEVLGVEKSQAGENACKIEHIISQDLIYRIEKYNKYCENHNEIIENFKREFDMF